MATLAIALLLTALPAQAADPFRTRNPKNIDGRTEQAFVTLFREGDYTGARELLATPTATEPLAFALKASLAYLYDNLEGLQTNAVETLRVAEQLKERDPLRGNLYVAAGHFLQGAYDFSRAENRVAAAPAVLGKLQQVFSALNEAERISPNDPELNLIRGYMDLMLAVNLPFADPNAAVQRLERHGAPAYLAQRGIAIGLRDLDRETEALAAVERAIAAATPTNPDLLYLKAQILVKQDKNAEARSLFQQALSRQNQLPPGLSQAIRYEACRNDGRIAGITANSPENDANRQQCRSQSQAQ